MKQIYILSLLTIFFSTSIVAQTTFDWESAVDNGDTVDQTVNTITASFGNSSNMPVLIDADGFGGSAGNVVVSPSGTSDTSVTINFSAPINVTSIFVFNGNLNAPIADWTLTPTGGSNATVISAIPSSAGVTVDLNWTAVTQIEITSANGLDWFGVDTIVSDFTLGTQEFDTLDSQVKLYPNPTTDYIQISGLKGQENFTLYNVLGTEVKNGSISNQEAIDVKNLTNGVYFLTISNGNTIKFIKK